MSEQIEAVSVNHGTPLYAELMLRSLFKHHPELAGLCVTVLETPMSKYQPPKAQTDSFHSYAASRDVSVRPTHLTKEEARGNTHGEILRNFVLGHRDCDYFLFLDSDVVFIQDSTIAVMLDELKGNPDAFGVQARLSWDGETEQPMGSMFYGGQKLNYRNKVSGPTEESVKADTPAPHLPLAYRMGARIHPCCCLLRNSAVFRKTAEYIGFSCAFIEQAQDGRYYDTMGLLTRVMRTHDLLPMLSKMMVMHFVGVSCNMRTPEKDSTALRLLGELSAV
ncbi:MAG: hypothetical protein GKR89_31895 [Candidatus Latescibacteria bacterium]|nr:hypothetical protein [Candidatus Latescibacterota bacterium]